MTTKDGLKPIEEIKLGDLVVAKDEVTGEVSWRPVINLFKNENQKVVRVTFVNNLTGAEDVIGATLEHPFWVDERGWVAASKLSINDKVVSIDGSLLSIVQVVLDLEKQTTYNFEVERVHTYFVGEQGAWVHNVSKFQGDVAKRVDFNFLNKAGKFYPDIPDLRTGKSITFPTGNLQRVPKADRVNWGSQERGAFIKEWYDRGYKTPRGGWAEYDIHHIQPREFGGSNDFWNLTPIQRKTHQQEFNSFWRDM